MSTSKEEFEKSWLTFEEAFKPRRWENIRDSWLGFVPIISPPGSLPPQTLSQFLETAVLFPESPLAKNKLSTAKISRAEVPEIIFREAIFWLHKALHVMGCSENHVDGGMLTWSLSEAYQSAYFAARAIMAFLGVNVGELQHFSVAVDMCRSTQGMRPQRLSEIGAFEEEIPFRSLGILFDHRQMWALFQRILRVTSCRVWPDGYLTYLTYLDIAKITEQRHGLHYKLNYWVMDDMHDFVFLDHFRDISPSGEGRQLFKTNNANFSLTLAAVITRMAVLLFADLSKLTNRLKDEKQIMTQTFSFERHPLFNEALKSYVG